MENTYRSRTKSLAMISPQFYQKREEREMTKKIDFTALAIYLMMAYMFARMFLFVLGVDL